MAGQTARPGSFSGLAEEVVRQFLNSAGWNWSRRPFRSRFQDWSTEWRRVCCGKYPLW